MGNKTQPGVRVDEDLYERFKQDAKERLGDRRGVVGAALERAMRNHIDGGEEAAMRRIEEDVASINAGVADLVQRIDRIEREAEGVHADGGAGGTLSTPDAHTHTDSERRAGRDAAEGVGETEDTDDLSKPDAKAPKASKAKFVFEDLGVDSIVTPPAVFDKKVSKAWGFGDRATDDIRERVFEQYHAEAVSVDGSTWQVAVGKTEADRDDAIADWLDGKEAGEDDLLVVPEPKFDGFDRNGVPKGVHRS